jgi:hypothetical protein
LRLAVDAPQGLGGFVSLQIHLGYLGNGYNQVGKPQSSDEGTSQPETAETSRLQAAGDGARAHPGGMSLRVILAHCASMTRPWRWRAFAMRQPGGLLDYRLPSRRRPSKGLAMPNSQRF